MHWRRYRTAAWLAVPIGCAIGVLAASLLIGGSPYARMPGEMHVLWHTTIVGVCFGAPTAFAALLGGFLVIHAHDPELHADPVHRTRIGALGAGLGAFAAWIVFGTVAAALERTMWPLLTMGTIGTVAATAAAIIAGYAIRKCERVAGAATASAAPALPRRHLHRTPRLR